MYNVQDQCTRPLDKSLTPSPILEAVNAMAMQIQIKQKLIRKYTLQ